MTEVESIRPKTKEPHFARRELEKLRWPKGPECPFCTARNPYRIKARHFSGVCVSRKPARSGLLKCRAAECRRQFTATTRTQFADTHLRAEQLLLMHRLRLEGKSLLEISRRLRVTYRTAWKFGHRWKMAEGKLFVVVEE